MIRYFGANAFNITKYDRNDAELECFLLFAIAVAGKNAATTDKAFEKLWRLIPVIKRTPFETIRVHILSGLLTPDLLRACGFGCYNHRFRSFKAAVNSGLDLRTCSTEDLEKIPGIGRKTSRFFILHSRKDARVACLDRHVMHFLADTYLTRLKSAKGFGLAPIRQEGKLHMPDDEAYTICSRGITPSKGWMYRYFEEDFLRIYENAANDEWYLRGRHLSLAEFDLRIWKSRTKSKAAA